MQDVLKEGWYACHLYNIIRLQIYGTCTLPAVMAKGGKWQLLQKSAHGRLTHGAV